MSPYIIVFVLAAPFPCFVAASASETGSFETSIIVGNKASVFGNTKRCLLEILMRKCVLFSMIMKVESACNNLAKNLALG